MIGDELGDRVTALEFEAAKLTGKVLLRALKAGLKKIAQLAGKEGKALAERAAPKEQSLHKLSKDGAQVQGSEVDRAEIAGFDRYARRYGLQYSLKRQKNDPQKYVLFFRTRDASRLDMAVRDAVKDGRLENDGLQDRIGKAKEKALTLNRGREKQRARMKVKGRTKGLER